MTSVRGDAQRLADELVGLHGLADAASIYEFDVVRGALVTLANSGYGDNSIELILRPDEGVQGRCFQTQELVFVARASCVEELGQGMLKDNLDGFRRLRAGLPAHTSVLNIPAAGGGLRGVLALEWFTSTVPLADPLSCDRWLKSWASSMFESIRKGAELRDTKLLYRRLVGKVLAATEEERKRVARELHDEVNQLLLSVRMDLEGIGRILPADMDVERRRLGHMGDRLTHALDDLRRLAVSLRPPAMDELGLAQALDWHVQGVSAEVRLPISLEVRGLTQRRAAPVVEMELFRIAQESISNVVKHAKASHARVELDFKESHVRLCIEDDGIGFNDSESKGGIGLLGMTERAKICGGTLMIESDLGRGTRITAEVPLETYDWGVY